MTIALFTVIDLETTGLEPPASIVEVGWTKVYFDPDTKHLEISAPQSRLFAPLEPMTPEVVAVHHLTDAMLAGFEPCSEDALAEIVQQDRPQFVVAANADFEKKWITDAILGRDLQGRLPHWVCTVKVAARLHPDADSHSNQAMRYRLGLDLPEALAMPPHRAGPDSYVTAHILAEFIKRGVRVSQMAQWTLEPRLITKLNFGKHRGTKLTDAPADYLQWICGQSDMDGDLKHWCALELERRRNAA